MRTNAIKPLAVAVCAVGFASACGGTDDFENQARPPAPVNVAVSISKSRISLSPAKVGAGEIILIVQNQSDRLRELRIETDQLGGAKPGTTQSTGPINAQGTDELKVDVDPGTYAVTVGAGGIAPARLQVGPERPSAQNKLLQP